MSRRVKYLVFMVVLIGLTVLTGCDFIYRLLQKEGAEERDIIGTVVPMEPNEQVRKVQALLKIYGYSVGNPDGILGTNTRVAIEKFQRDNALKVTRFIDKATWAQLLVFEQNGFILNDKLNLKTVQIALKAAGFDPGPLDGRPGHKTEAAIRSFQHAAGLKPDGKVGLNTLRELAKYIE